LVSLSANIKHAELLKSSAHTFRYLKNRNLSGEITKFGRN
jgi:hypothetical protein